MKIYDDYLRPIREAMNADKKQFGINEREQFSARKQNGRINLKAFNEEVPEKQLLPALENFANTLGLVPNFEQSLGLHPDFAYLKASESLEEHYIVSMFLDIKGSTNLFKKYTPQTVWIITNTIQRAAIHTCLIFGGYVHRLQGDGLFVYFGGKDVSVELAVERALQFASVFTYFVKEDLRKLFLEQGIDNIYTRIGVDLGFDADVVWGMAGIGQISEVTTCSLHTSLASKMQGSAISNGIVVGDNIKKANLNIADFCTTVASRTNSESDRYIFRSVEDGLYYAQYDFNWLKFLKKQAYIATDIYGSLQLKGTSSKNLDAAKLVPIASVSKPYFD